MMFASAHDIRVPDATLDDLRERLATTRLPSDDSDSWEAGTSPAYLRALLEYWRSAFDWRAQEAQLARFAHFSVELDRTRIHFIHERSRASTALPIVLTHGYPDTFYRFHTLIPLLTDPAAYGGDPHDAFDVVVPSLPGFAYSEPFETHDGIFGVADLWHQLMTGLGYTRYGAHGGDWGSMITERLARNYPEAVIGIHLTDVPFWHSFRKPRTATAAERAYLAEVDAYQRDRGAYAMMQGRRPQTLADGLADSPAGHAAWLLQFFHDWSDCGGDLESVFTRDELLTSIMLPWVTGSIASSFTPYHDVMHAGAARWIVELARQKAGEKHVPAGFAMFPKELTHPPREWAERFFDVHRWTTMPRGGHFAAMEQPELLAKDIRAFFRPLR